MDSKIWSAFMTTFALVAAAMAKKGLNTSWRAASGKQPPTNPADPNVDAKEALLWAALSGMVFSIVRTFASRRAASYVARSKAPRP